MASLPARFSWINRNLRIVSRETIKDFFMTTQDLSKFTVEDFLHKIPLSLEWKNKIRSYIDCIVVFEELNSDECTFGYDEYLFMLNEFWVIEYNQLYDVITDAIIDFKNTDMENIITQTINDVVDRFSNNINEKRSKNINNSYRDKTPREPKQPIIGFVYIAKQTNEENIYKFGVTQNIKGREQAFRIGNAFISMIASLRSVNYRKIERIMHSRLKEFNISGEWFDIPSEYISEIIKEYGFTKYLEDNK